MSCCPERSARIWLNVSSKPNVSICATSRMSRHRHQKSLFVFVQFVKDHDGRASLQPYTPAIAFPSTMITSSQTWQRITTRPFSLWNPSLDGKGELTNQTDREIRR